MKGTSINDRLIAVMGEILDVDLSGVAAETPRDQIVGWDSLNHLQMVMAVEREFGVRFSMERIPELDSIAAVRAAIEEQL